MYVETLPNPIEPVQLLFPLTLRSAPTLLIPAPVKLNALPTLTPPNNSTVAPLDTVVIEELPKPLLLVKRNVPLFTLVAPLYTFTPAKVNLPTPSLVMVPVPKLITPLTTTFPLPPTCKLILLLLIEELPPKVNVAPESLLIRVVALTKVTVPAQLLVPLILRNAPPLLTPVPVKLNGKAPILIPPCNCKTAPLDTVVCEEIPNPLL